jgi:hypothetical protein
MKALFFSEVKPFVFVGCRFATTVDRAIMECSADVNMVWMRRLRWRQGIEKYDHEEAIVAILRPVVAKPLSRPSDTCTSLGPGSCTPTA